MCVTSVARADDELEAHADRVTIDPRARELGLAGDVRLSSPPFYLRSDELQLRTRSIGIDVLGKGELTFCPCLGTPLTLTFHDALVAPPGDLILYSPKLKVFGVPIFWLPLFWVRSRARPGLLPPDVAYRGADGFRIGAGFHLPWNPPTNLRDAGNDLGFDASAGAYVRGGAYGTVELRTDTTHTRVQWDALKSAGATVDASGHLTDGERALTWDADLIRGERALVATSELNAASKRLDRAWLEASHSFASGYAFSALEYAAERQGTMQRFGPAIGLAFRLQPDPLLSIRGRLLAGATNAADGYAVAVLEGRSEVFVGPVVVESIHRGAVEVAGDETSRPVGAVFLERATAGLPLVRAYGTALRHRVEPGIFSSVAFSRGSPIFVGALANFPAGRSFAGGASLASVLGDPFTRTAWTFDVAAGGVAAADRQTLAVRWHLGLGTRGASIRADGGHTDAGSALRARVRVGAVSSANVIVDLEHARGNGRWARLLGEPATEVTGGFFDSPAFALGVRGQVPFPFGLTAYGGSNVDLDASRLTRVAIGLLAKDSCRCLAARLEGAHRLGREGVDVTLTFDLAPR